MRDHGPVHLLLVVMVVVCYHFRLEIVWGCCGAGDSKAVMEAGVPNGIVLGILVLLEDLGRTLPGINDHAV